MIQIYTTTKCAHCQEAKNYFTSKGLEFEVFDISKDTIKKQEILDAGYRSVPIIKINNEVIVGWDKQKVEALL